MVIHVRKNFMTQRYTGHTKSACLNNLLDWCYPFHLSTLWSIQHVSIWLQLPIINIQKYQSICCTWESLSVPIGLIVYYLFNDWTVRSYYIKTQLFTVSSTFTSIDLPKFQVCTSTCPESSSLESEDVDCMLSEWSHWSDCSSTCGDGVQVRQKMIKRPAQGQGRQCDSENMKEMRDCNMGLCELQDYKMCMVS